MLLVGALVVGGAPTARAGTSADTRELMDRESSMFVSDFGLDADRTEEIVALAKELVLDEHELPPDAEFYWFGPVDHHVTGAVESADGDVCRGAVVFDLISWREDELVDGRRGGFTYEITCGPWTFTGTWHPYGTSPLSYEGYGTWTMTQAQGDDQKQYSAYVMWDEAKPDPADPAQWLTATTELVSEIDAELDRVVDEANRNLDVDTIAAKAEDVSKEIDEQLQRLDSFDVIDGGEKMLTAERKWLTTTKTALEKGDLHKLLDRAGPYVPTTKAYVKKTKAIRKKWEKGRAKRNVALAKAVDAYAKAFQ
jgi:hypothetical protein